MQSTAFRRTQNVVLRMCVVALLSGPPGLGQSPAEGVVAQARSMASSGRRAEALALLQQRLEHEPADTDARTLYGIVLSWESRYDEARAALQSVLAQHPDHGDALRALINVELWSDHPAEAGELAEHALRSEPRDVTLLLAKVRAALAAHRSKPAREALEILYEVDPTNPDAKKIRAGMEDRLRTWELVPYQSYEWFNHNFPAWFESQITLEDHTSMGSLLASFSAAQRFSRESNQVLVEAYPVIRKGTYAYVSAGGSDGKLYPHYQVGAELYQNVTHGFEISGGMRHMQFADSVTFYTGSLSKYYRNWLFTTRTYVTPGGPGNSVSMQYSTRRYLRDGSSYVGLHVSHGRSPVETGSLNEIEVLHSFSAWSEANLRIAQRWSIVTRFGAGTEDRLDTSRLRHYLVNGALYFRF